MPRSILTAALLCAATVCAGCASAPAAPERDSTDPMSSEPGPRDAASSDAASGQEADAPEPPPELEVDSALLMAWSRDPERVARGAQTYQANCAACHGAQAQGVIGPNHTDDAWLHGAEPIDHYDVIASGVPERGMPAWEPILPAQQRAEVVAYLITLRGTNPPGARDPQGSTR
jgi:cytochrome c oxidase cbb3-type subunit 3